MTETAPRDARWRVRTLCRVGWTVASICLVEAAVCGLSLVPVLLLWMWLVEWTTSAFVLRTVVFSVSIVPSYILFALCLMTLSPIATRLTLARTPRNAEMRLADLSWPLMTWARYMAATQVVRQLAGPLFRGSPIWTAYLRLNGARIGRRVYVNTLFISDHNLLELGDDVVIGAGVHISGHTVEGGALRTAGVRLGRNVTVGLGSVIGIDVEAGHDCQVGALSLVPKHTTLEAGAVYAGIPARRIDQQAPAGSGDRRLH
jgi:acetyltransferase-like isoleucine patch superfamily enzyme